MGLGFEVYKLIGLPSRFCDRYCDGVDRLVKRALKLGGSGAYVLNGGQARLAGTDESVTQGLRESQTRLLDGNLQGVRLCRCE